MNQPAEPSSPEPEDQAILIQKPRMKISWAWLFPMIAVLASAWLFWNQWREKGPEIEIRFSQAPGMQAGKTLLMYRGVPAGKVTEVAMDHALKEVVLKVRLYAFADELARDTTVFWIDQPVISLQEVTGLQSIIQGNSIQARLGEGPRRLQFRGLEKAPVFTTENHLLGLRLRASHLPSLTRGTPVYRRGVVVGRVRDTNFDEKGEPYLEVVIDSEHRHLIRTTSRFWPLPATSLTVGPGGVTLDINGLDALVQGGIAFDDFDQEGLSVEAPREFPLSPSEAVARAVGEPFEITFADGNGLLPHQTRVTYLGQPVGIVEKVVVDPAQGRVKAVARLEPGYEYLRRGGSEFALVRPKISLEGISGLETLLTGPNIAVETVGQGSLATQFAGRTVSEDEWDLARANRDGMIVHLTALSIAQIERGAPVYYRGMMAGTILEKALDEKGNPALRALIFPEFRREIGANTRFWRVPATSVEAGPGVLKMRIPGLAALWHGGVAFDNFSDAGAAVTSGSSFALLTDEASARAISEPIEILFTNGRGLLAGQTQVRYLGQPVGVVEDVQVQKNRVKVTARLYAGFDFLRSADSRFSLVQPRISVRGVTGLETLVSGVFIECVPGVEKRRIASFVGFAPDVMEDAPQTGLEIRLATKATTLDHGAPVVYRDMRVGSVVGKTLSQDSDQVLLTVAIEKRYVPLIREHTKFWDASGVNAKLGIFSVQIRGGALLSSAGRIGMATPPKAEQGKVARSGQIFQLYPEPQKRWFQWNPDIDLGPEPED